ncbi:hypothetical protein [Bacillus sp. JJ722]|uniref:hypothetical protein n=1 Tax=Bacillus sp. JJ722 TaxID=3122973 RepID=UPI002FFDAD93
MTRRILEQGFNTIDHERLTIITIYEEGINKERVKKENGFSKKHQVLVPNGHSYAYLK